MYVIFMHIAIIFLPFYYLYAKYFRFSNNQNKTSEDLYNTSTVPPSCFQRTNSNYSDVTMNDSYQVMLESLSQLNRNVSLSLQAFLILKFLYSWHFCILHLYCFVVISSIYAQVFGL